MVRKAVIAILLVLFAAPLLDADTGVREPVVAGRFYPSDSALLANMVQSHLDSVKDLPEIDGKIVALIVPHAGLIYSGQIAAHSYRLLENSGVDRVILCGPSHQYSFNGVSVYGPGITWKTPLGNVACDDDLCRQLLKSHPIIDIVEQAHSREHSLEVQLPYLQRVLPTFTIVPVVMGRQSPEDIRILADGLASLEFDTNTVMVASTDWQHRRPASEGFRMDSLGMECLQQFDPERLERLLMSGSVELCGGGPTVAVMKAARAKGANRVKLLRYGDSGDISGDKSSVVGYAAAVLYKSTKGDHISDSTSPATISLQPEGSNATVLSDADKRQLLQIARKSIEQYLKDRTVPEFEVAENLRLPGAAFVTLEKHGRLRGCIGHTMAVEPLYKTVSTCAIQAAFSDRRFPPVQADELSKLHIEISVLTPLEEVRSLDEIEVGRDGLMVVQGDYRGLLLPQVAVEYGWNCKEFLQHTCRKAGLPADAYQQPGAVIYRYQALIFGE